MMRQRSEHKPARLNFTTTRVLKQLFLKTFPAFEPWQRRHDRHRDMKRRNKLRLMPSSHHPTRRDATKTVLSSRVGWCELGSTRTRNKKNRRQLTRRLLHSVLADDYLTTKRTKAVAEDRSIDHFGTRL